MLTLRPLIDKVCRLLGQTKEEQHVHCPDSRGVVKVRDCVLGFSTWLGCPVPEGGVRDEVGESGGL